MKTLRRSVRLAGNGAVSSVWRIPEQHAAGRDRVLVIAHGAGSTMHSAFIDYVHRNLALRGCVTVKFNFPYAEHGRRAPDRPAVLKHAWRAVLARVESDPCCVGSRIYLSGKSLGGRIASHIAVDSRPAGLVFFGFPLHSPARQATRRAAHLAALTVPMLFIQGTRDRLCDLALLQTVLVRLKGPYRLHLIDDGDHSFKVPKRARRDERSVWDEIVAVADAWMANGDAGDQE